jgi:hypothetical protein
VVRVSPGPRALDEQLKRVGADLRCSLRSRLDAAGNVAAEEHAPTIVA